MLTKVAKIEKLLNLVEKMQILYQKIQRSSKDDS